MSVALARTRLIDSIWYRRSDLNRESIGYKPTALTIMLRLYKAPLEATLLNRSGDQSAESCDSADPVYRQAVIALERFDSGSESVSENSRTLDTCRIISMQQ